MKSLITTGEAMMLAREGQEQIARALQEALRRRIAGIMKRFFRRPAGTS